MASVLRITTDTDVSTQMLATCGMHSECRWQRNGPQDNYHGQEMLRNRWTACITTSASLPPCRTATASLTCCIYC
jgi:hypothetical protein